MANLLQNISIRTKVISAFAIVLCCGMALGLYAMAEVKHLNASTDSINDNVTGLRQLSAMGTQIERIRVTDGLLLITPTAEGQADLASKSAEARRMFNRHFADYEASIDPGEEQQLANGIRAGWERFQAAEQGFASMVQS
ncbi:MCP four helix bundle domain-containing protein, partial [Teichococcus vastitatis]|uniref:MCP four helix bundle domain-containing protein n=1 Tax=Teichococcus vastitatis TaxID=2307076 RepID=UPI00138FC9EB